MTKRTTIKDIEEEMKIFNKSYLDKHNVYIDLGIAYGKKFIYLYSKKGDKQLAKIKGYLTSGEVIRYLEAMEKGIDLFVNKRYK